MKRVKLKNGWDEVTTKSFRVTGQSKIFKTAGDWVAFVKQSPTLDYGGKNHCERCGIRWADADPATKT